MSIIKTIEAIVDGKGGTVTITAALRVWNLRLWRDRQEQIHTTGASIEEAVKAALLKME